MYTSKYWWEVIGGNDEYLRLRYRGHYITISLAKVDYDGSVADYVLNHQQFPNSIIGFPARIERFHNHTALWVYAPDYNAIRPPITALMRVALNRWRKLMGR